MTRRALSFSAIVVGSLVWAAPLPAHHSFAAEYDSTKPVKLTGAVTRVDWMNPHAYFYIDVKDAASGRVQNTRRLRSTPTIRRSIGAPAAGLDSKHAEGWRCDYCRRNSREGRRQSWERQIGYQCRYRQEVRRGLQ